ncbi:MAG: methyltransferase [Candidatus Omnitrophica bacterium]|nr:methyltransferase [Candidatus Omnitrophota bacterium]
MRPASPPSLEYLLGNRDLMPQLTRRLQEVGLFIEQSDLRMVIRQLVDSELELRVDATDSGFVFIGEAAVRAARRIDQIVVSRQNHSIVTSGEDILVNPGEGWARIRPDLSITLSSGRNEDRNVRWPAGLLDSPSDIEIAGNALGLAYRSGVLASHARRDSLLLHWFGVLSVDVQAEILEVPSPRGSQSSTQAPFGVEEKCEYAFRFLNGALLSGSQGYSRQRIDEMFSTHPVSVSADALERLFGGMRPEVEYVLWAHDIPIALVASDGATTQYIALVQGPELDVNLAEFFARHEESRSWIRSNHIFYHHIKDYLGLEEDYIPVFPGVWSGYFSQPLIECMLEVIEEGATVVDLGSGSGVISVAAARNLRPARVVAVDIDRIALEDTRIFSERYGVQNMIDIVRSDALSEVEGPVDWVVMGAPIPQFNSTRIDPAREDSGAGLLKKVLSGLPRVLSEEGALLLLYHEGFEHILYRILSEHGAIASRIFEGDGGWRVYKIVPSEMSRRYARSHHFPARFRQALLDRWTGDFDADGAGWLVNGPGAAFTLDNEASALLAEAQQLFGVERVQVEDSTVGPAGTKIVVLMDALEGAAAVLTQELGREITEEQVLEVLSYHETLEATAQQHAVDWSEAARSVETLVNEMNEFGAPDQQDFPDSFESLLRTFAATYAYEDAGQYSLETSQGRENLLREMCVHLITEGLQLGNPLRIVYGPNGERGNLHPWIAGELIDLAFRHQWISWEEYQELYRIAGGEFWLERLDQDGLLEYPELLRLIEPDIKMELLYDPEFVPVFTEVLPRPTGDSGIDASKPIQPVQQEALEEFGTVEDLYEYSVFKPGPPWIAQRVLDQGRTVRVGIADRRSYDLSQDHWAMNGRRTNFPLKDGSWLSVIGGGQNLNSNAPAQYAGWTEGSVPYIRQVGLMKWVEVEMLLDALELLGEDTEPFLQTLGFQELARIPDEGGVLRPVGEFEYPPEIQGGVSRELDTERSRPYLVFQRTPYPLRKEELAKRKQSDPEWRAYRRGVTKSFRGLGIIPPQASPGLRELMLLDISEMGRAAAFKQNHGIYKITYTMHDLPPGREADVKESLHITKFLERYEDFIERGVVSGLRDDEMKLILDYGLFIKPVHVNLAAVAWMAEIGRVFSLEEGIRVYFRSYFGNLNDQYLELYKEHLQNWQLLPFGLNQALQGRLHGIQSFSFVKALRSGSTKGEDAAEEPLRRALANERRDEFASRARTLMGLMAQMAEEEASTRPALMHDPIFDDQDPFVEALTAENLASAL